jgi:hypothetical protein
MWETFKSDIKKIAKDHTKSSTHKMNVRARMLEKARKTTIVTRDFDTNEALQTEEALTNEITHLGCAMAKTRKEIFQACRNHQGKKLGGIWSA